MKKLLSCAAAAVALSGLAAAPAHAARDYVWAAGSSTVFPFAVIGERIFSPIPVIWPRCYFNTV